ncbi:hypothetical protein IAU60_004714 [Kwoniella sp. DSM 27419]
MERSSSQRDLRVERLSKTPYTRPEPSKLRRSASITPLSTLRSIVNYVSSPFSRSQSLLPQHTSDLQADPVPDTKSESGSEDGWNGEAPVQMDGQDVFDLAAAAGRQGKEFENRAATWRAKGDRLGGRRELDRLALKAEPTETDLPTPTALGHFNLLSGSPSMPTLTASTTLSSSLSRPMAGSSLATERSRASLYTGTSSAIPARTPLQTSQPGQVSTPNGASGLSASASSAALTAFLDAKKGQPMSAEDFRVIDTLTENMKAESHVGSPRSVRAGGWAAGSYSNGGASALRASQSLATLSTPAKQIGSPISVTTPGSGPLFSVGSGPTPGAQPSPYKQRYLGPGMSPRRMFPQPKKSALKPLFSFRVAEDAVAKGKKRKTDDEEVMDLDEQSLARSTPPAHKAALSSSVSMPSLVSLGGQRSKSQLAPPQHTPARPSPLSRTFDSPNSVTSTPKDDAKSKRKVEAEAAGRKRAAEIIMDIIDEEIGPVVPTRKTEPVVFNPYDRTSLNPAANAPAVPVTSPSTAFAGSTPGKTKPGSQLSPARRTPTRGAAAKLEAHRESMKSSQSLSTIDRIKGVRPWAGAESPARSRREETGTPDDDIIEIDELVDQSEAEASRSASRVGTPEPSRPAFVSASSKIPPAETFKPFNTPSLTYSSQPLPKASPVPSFGNFDSPTRDSIIDASRKQDQTVPKPSFAFTPAPPAEQETIKPVETTKTFVPKADFNAVYLSAKDSALKIAKPALPFFTFTLPALPLTPAMTRAQAEQADAVKAEASKRTPPVFSFTLSASAPAAKQSAGAEWTCDTCMLKNPASATDKCTICEAPKPASAPAKSAPIMPSFGSASAPSASSEWTCNLCMLKNPASATDKCTICEAPKPKPTASAAAPPSGSMFGFGAPKPGGNEWTCNTCMLKNPMTATEKCTICEAPKPQATTASAPASSGATFGGFTGFGAGMGVKKAEEGEWTCSTCMLKNPASAKDKCTICESKR